VAEAAICRYYAQHTTSTRNKHPISSVGLSAMPASERPQTAQYLPIFADVGGMTCDETGHSRLIYVSVYFFYWFAGIKTPVVRSVGTRNHLPT